MVVQRDKPVMIWGWADVGEQVTVSFAGQKTQATAAADRSWKVRLEKMPANSAPQNLIIQGYSKTLDKSCHPPSVR